MSARKFLFWVITLGIMISQSLLSQTPGTLTFTMTTTSSGGYSPNHLLAIWIEDNSGNFIKTKLKNSSNGNLDHLSIWTSKSAQNVVDATTGATLTSHGTVTVNWNGTNAGGSLVPDGNYKVWVEMAWTSNLITGKTSTSFSFTKGTAAVHLLPTSQTNFTGITLDWNPSVTASIKNYRQNEDILVYPNPTSDRINISLKNTSKCLIKILNVAGVQVYGEILESNEESVKSVDLSRFPDGIYFVSVETGNKISIIRVVKN